MLTYFYHERIRKSVAIFGTMFNNIYVLRKDSSGKVRSQVKVPLSYAPKAKYLDRIRENLDQHEVLEYHFSIKSSEKRIVFRMYGNMVTARSYEFSDTEVLKVYDEFSNFKYINQNRKYANVLSKLIYNSSSLDSIKKVYIISEGILKYIPFHALNYKNKYLSENFEVSYLPSLSSFLNLTGENSPLNFLGVGDPFFDALEKDL